jgi:energy-coupling factor transport system ATP-binding protein
MPKILFENVQFAYPNGTVALKKVNLRINSGELMAIMGQNGAGKTTLVRMINGLLRPNQGAVYIDGENIIRDSIANLSKKVGIIFQNPSHQLFSNTVEDEIKFSLKNLGFNKQDLLLEVERTLNEYDFVKYRSRSPLNLSGGEAKRLALASIMCRNPEILIFDEPTLGQDMNGIESFVRLMGIENDKGKTIIIVTHNVEFAMENLPRTILMQSGKIIADGPTAKLLTNENLIEQSSLIFPQIHQFRLKLKEEGFDIPDEIKTTSDYITYINNIINQNN